MGNPFEQNTTAWLSTTASQIFFMQLGFLSYEVGFCKPVWTQSLILKNIEDTFVGILIFLCFGYTLSQSTDSFYGIIAIPTNPFLIGVPSSLHDQILISAFFASTCATIISGAVLERMKNGAYVIWCSLIILINYSFVSHWVWHHQGWLHKLGFVDGAGAVVVHSTAGMASLIAVWRLGVRKESIGERDQLLPIENASRPIINAMGAFFLWYGWFAFNVASPVAFSKGIGDAIGTTAMVTVVSPICAAGLSFFMMHKIKKIPLSFENLLNCLLAGLVSITGSCHTCDIWEAAFIGFLATILYFIMIYTLRYKWRLDDPLQVVTIHLFCGLYSGFAEGVVANDVYQLPGLIHGGFKHFGVQLLGVVVIAIFNFLSCWFLWDIVMVRILFRKSDIRVSILDIYLGTRLFHENYDMALDEVLNCESNTAKTMLWQFQRYVFDRFAGEQLDFLMISKIFSENLQIEKKNEIYNSIKMAKYVIQIIDTYIDENGCRCINISYTQRSILLKFKNQILMELNESTKGEKKKEKKRAESVVDICKENIFRESYNEIKRIILPSFTQFLRFAYKYDQKSSFAVKMPFTLKDDWTLEWDQNLIKETDAMKLADTIPEYRESRSLLTNKQQSQLSLQQIEKTTQFTVIYENDQRKKEKEENQQMDGQKSIIID